MFAITVRNIPPRLMAAIRQRADASGLSLNKTVLRMLEEAAGQRKSVRELHPDLDHLAGSWSEKEAAAFETALSEQRTVDSEHWT